MAAPILLAAQRLADLGLAVHWLWGPDQGPPDIRKHKPGKIPARSGWQDRSALTALELAREYRPGRNLGLHTGLVLGAKISLVALDIDGEAGFVWCARRGIPLSPVRTLTRNGQHWLYRHPGTGCRVANRVKIDPGKSVDIRGDGGNLVLAPSWHHTGFQYQPVEPWTDRLLARCPTFDPAWFETESSREHTLPLPFSDVLAARRALQKMLPAVQGQNGSRACYIAACTLIRRYKLDEPNALALLLSDYNPRCVPPWSERELQHKVRDAAKRYAGPQGASES